MNQRLQAVEKWEVIDNGECLRRGNTELIPDPGGQGGVEVYKDHLSCYLPHEVLRELLRVQGYKIVKDPG